MIHDFAAHQVWSKRSKPLQENLINNVWCGDCRGETTIVDFQPTLHGDLLVLEGRCITCGSEVARVIE